MSRLASTELELRRGEPGSVAELVKLLEMLEADSAWVWVTSLCREIRGELHTSIGTLRLVT